MPVKSPRKSKETSLAKLEALDLSSLSEELRISAIAEVRAQIAEVTADKRADAPMLGRKLALLRLWQRLVQMRIADVKEEIPPPEVRVTPVRMFPPDPEPEVEEPAPEVEVVAPPPQPKRKNSTAVMVKLSEEAVIKGKTVAAGETVQVSRREADGLLESGKATVVDKQ